jgi:predicted CXXCH cytochrome family protein
MGQSLAPASQSAQLALAPAPVKVGRFKVFRRDGSLYQSEIEMDQFGNAIGETVHKLEYVVGSGVNGFGYIVEQNQHLAEAPLSYYAKSKKWDLSPGFESAEHGFDRPIAAACLACHSGRSQPVPRRLGVYLTPPFLEMAIGCENCHGPGGAHAARPAKANIVNPARLPVRETGQVCLGCHQDPAPTPRTTLLAHDSSLRLSKCFQASGGRLTCTTCHDPHSTISKTAAPAHYRTKCLTCHTDESCGLPGHGADCAGCHMAKRPLREIPHTALTSHRISLPL